MNFATAPRRALPVLVVGRALSTGGDVLLRVSLASAAAEASRSTLLAGLVIVAPAVGATMLRRILPRMRADLPSLARYGVAVELGRAAAFVGLSVSPSLWVGIPVIIASGALQGPFEGAFGAVFADVHRGTAVRRVNVWLRMSMLAAALLAAAIASRVAVGIGGAAFVDGLTFLASAASLLIAQRPAARPDTTVTAAVAGPVGTGGHLASITNGYTGAALGLALCAPSMVSLSAAALAPWSVGTRPAYAIYSGVVAIGSVIGGALRVAWERPLGRLGGLACVLGVCTAGLLALDRAPAWFLLLTGISALAEMVLVVEINARAQSELTAAQCADFLTRLRGRLAAVATLGLVVNVAWAARASPFAVAIGASAIGAVVGSIALELRAPSYTSTRLGEPTSPSPGPRTSL